MSESKYLEYALRWPDTGELVKGTYGTASEANVARNDMALKLHNLGFPARFVPKVCAKVVKTQTSDWLDLEDAEALFQAEKDTGPVLRKVYIRQDMTPKDTVLVPPQQVDDQQVARVRSGCFSFHDPCVVCGNIFKECPHSVAETVAMIKRVDPSKRIRR